MGSLLKLPALFVSLLAPVAAGPIGGTFDDLPAGRGDAQAQVERQLKSLSVINRRPYAARPPRPWARSAGAIGGPSRLWRRP
jgi:hypothetical protein